MQAPPHLTIFGPKLLPLLRRKILDARINQEICHEIIAIAVPLLQLVNQDGTTWLTDTTSEWARCYTWVKTTKNHKHVQMFNPLIHEGCTGVRVTDLASSNAGQLAFLLSTKKQDIPAGLNGVHQAWTPCPVQLEKLWGERHTWVLSPRDAYSPQQKYIELEASRVKRRAA